MGRQAFGRGKQPAVGGQHDAREVVRGVEDARSRRAKQRILHLARDAIHPASKDSRAYAFALLALRLIDRIHRSSDLTGRARERPPRLYRGEIECRVVVRHAANRDDTVDVADARRADPTVTQPTHWIAAERRAVGASGH